MAFVRDLNAMSKSSYPQQDSSKIEIPFGLHHLAASKRSAKGAGLDPLHLDHASSDEEQARAKQAKPSFPTAGKKTKGRVKIKMEFIDNKLRRYTTFSKRKTGIMKKAYELSTLTGTQVMLLVASETGHVYTFATRKLQPMITSDAGKALIQTCLNSPDPPPEPATGDQRMSATGYEETELNYSVYEEEEELRGDDEREEYSDEEDEHENPSESVESNEPKSAEPVVKHLNPTSKSLKHPENERGHGWSPTKPNQAKEPVNIAPKRPGSPPPGSKGGMYIQTREGVVFAPSIAAIPPHILAQLIAAGSLPGSAVANMQETTAVAADKTPPRLPAVAADKSPPHKDKT